MRKILFLLMLTPGIHAVTIDTYSIKVITGQEQQPLIPFVAQQRITAYREYPYLYEGSMEEENSYLGWLVSKPSSALAIAYSGTEPVGFLGGVGFVDFDEHFKGSVDLFKTANLDPANYYYFTDVIVKPEHRGHGLGIKLFQTLEAYAQSRGYTAGCCVTESHNEHPLKPADYKSVAVMLQKLGYAQSPMAINFTWMTRQDGGKTGMQEHVLDYWIKEFKSVGSRYIDFLTTFGQSERTDFAQEMSVLFAPEIKKIVNSKLICKNRDELITQMQNIKDTYGIHTINLLESLTSNDNKSAIIRWEITFAKDASTETIISILKYNNDGLIEEINEVFGDKAVYSWPS